jgi:HEAT repeat protein
VKDIFLSLFDATAQEIAVLGGSGLAAFALFTGFTTVSGRWTDDRTTGRSAKRWNDVTTNVRAFMHGNDHAARKMTKHLRRSTTRDQLVSWVSIELNHTDPRRRAQAAEIAATLRLRSSRAALALATDDPDATVRIAACRALAGISPDDAFAALIRLVESDGTWAADLLAHLLQTGTIEQQSRFARVLSERMLTWAPNAAVVRLLANDDLLQNNMILVRALRAHDPEIQIRAAEALRTAVVSATDLAETTDALVECLASDHEMLRLAAVRALTSLARDLDRDIMLVFAALLGDASRLVRYAAAHGLALLPHSRGVLTNIKGGPDPAAAEAASLALWQLQSGRVPDELVQVS